MNEIQMSSSAGNPVLPLAVVGPLPRNAGEKTLTLPANAGPLPLPQTGEGEDGEGDRAAAALPTTREDSHDRESGHDQLRRDEEEKVVDGPPPRAMTGSESDGSPFVFTPTSGVPIRTEELLADMRRVAHALKSDFLSGARYHMYGQYSQTTALDRFGTWNKALIAAGLRVKHENKISDERLLENILRVWTELGRQPTIVDLSRPPSQFGEAPYRRRFGTWTRALKQFVIFAGKQELRLPHRMPVPVFSPVRVPSLQLRFRVMQRDQFRCRTCGKSPANDRGVELHVDHVAPWSLGGKTVEENLQTLCSSCNMGKGDSTPG